MSDFMKKRKFYTVFTVHPDGSVEPRERIRIGGIEFGPGVHLWRGVVFSGIDLFDYVGHDLETKKSRGVTVITGIY